MEVHGLSWMGVRVSDLAAAVAFFEALGLERDHAEGEMVAFTAKNGDTVEVFGPGDADHRHFGPPPRSSPSHRRPQRPRANAG